MTGFEALADAKLLCRAVVVTGVADTPEDAARRCETHGVTHAIDSSVGRLAAMKSVRYRYAIAPAPDELEAHGTIAVRPMPDLAAAVNEVFRTFGYWKTVTMGTRPTLYLDFRNVHLEQASEEQFNEFSKLSEAAFGVEWHRADGRTRYLAPSGIQKWGVVGPDGKPNHSAMTARPAPLA